jgi:hypothetical protein
VVVGCTSTVQSTDIPHDVHYISDDDDDTDELEHIKNEKDNESDDYGLQLAVQRIEEARAKRRRVEQDVWSKYE